MRGELLRNPVFAMAATAVIQGFGNVGSHAAYDLSNSGVKITGVSDLSGALWNAGGVTVSYFEWVQNLQRFQWTEREVLTKLDTVREGAFARVLAFAERHRLPHRTAAQALAIKTVADAKAQRGMFP